MKKILFLIIGTLLVLGLVLPGCGDTPEGNIIQIAVVGPMTDLQGQNHWDGATMAAEEINDAGGIDVGGTVYDVELVKVETKEATEGEDGTTGSGNLKSVINDVTFCVGGFRTEVVTVYREEAMDAEKLFMNCGAATGALQFSVVTDYDKYKYWFKSTPYNETFLVKSCIRMTATIGGTLGASLAGIEGINPAYVQDDYKMSLAVNGKPRVAILMEDAAWCAAMVPAAQYYLPLQGFNTTGDGSGTDWTWKVSPTAADISTELSAIAAIKPHIIFTAFSGSVGAVYSNQRNSLGIPAMTIGINVPGQQLIHWSNTGGDCVGEVMLDTFPIGVNVTPLTEDWVDTFVARFGRYPVYTAATYDAIMAVCKAIDETNSLDSAVLVDWLEDLDNAYTDGVGTPSTAYYPMPAIEIIPDTLYALNQTQKEALYGTSYAYDQADWMVGWYDPGTGPIQQPHIAHDTVYGPGYQTGTGTQWQEVTGSGVKLGIWPMVLPGPSIDQYGDWSFEYPGTADLYLPIGSDEPTGGMLTIPNPI
jgi:branched-chain amino acid transport system substrate-binding protein